MLIRIFRTLAGIALLLATIPTVQAGVSVAYVDAARLLKEAPQIQQIRQGIRVEFEARDQRLEEMQRQIGLLEARLAAEGERMPAEEKRRLKSDINQRRLKFKQARDTLAQDKQMRFSEEEQHFSRVMQEVIQQVAQDEKIDLVLQGGVLWVSPEINITERVLGRLRAMLGQDG